MIGVDVMDDLKKVQAHIEQLQSTIVYQQKLIEKYRRQEQKKKFNFLEFFKVF